MDRFKAGGPQRQVFWFLNKSNVFKKCRGTIKTDVVIIGGGIAGLSAAQAFRQRGLSVVLLEQHMCGSGASGKSSGFITPNSEIDLAHLKRRYGIDRAHAIWEFVGSGVKHIQDNIKKYDISCDYRVQDSLILANDVSGLRAITQEHQARCDSNYYSRLYTHTELNNIVGSTGYVGAQRYGGSFGINAYAYCQGMRKVLIDSGVQIYEETPVVSIQDHQVQTADATIHAEHIIDCADWAIPELGKLVHEIYHAQTFLLVSAPLTDDQIRRIFPQDHMMAWDTDLLYQYFRLIGDNRLLLGGSTYLETYAKQPNYHAHTAYKKLTDYFYKKFPDVKPQFEYMWPGLIGISKDVLGIIGPDKQNPSIYYVGAATGLPWAAAFGNYSAEHIVDKRTDMDAFFSPTRSFPLGRKAQFLLGKRLTFALSNLITLKWR